MPETNLQVNVDAILKRALDIYCAIEGKNRKDIISAALKEVIPQRFIDEAITAFQKEGGE